MRAVVTVIGKDREGIIAQVSSVLWNRGINILDIAQNVLEDVFAMVMLVDISKSGENFSSIKSELEDLGAKIDMKIHIMHEDIFNSMHKI